MTALSRPSADGCPQCGHLGAYERSFCPVAHYPAPDLPREVRARMRLYAALIQCCASDDVIIREHMRSAYELLGGDLVDLDARNPGGAL